MLELVIALLVTAWLLVLTYLTSAGALQLSALVGLADEDLQGTVKGRWRALTKSPREVLLAADLFKSLAFAIMIVLAFWSIPRWARGVELPPWICLAIALPILWIAHVQMAEALPRRVALATPDPRLISMRLATLALIWRVFRPVLALIRWVAMLRPVPARTTEREEIVDRAFDSLADSIGMEEPVIEPEERDMIRGVIGLENTEVREVMVPRVNIVAIPVDATFDDVRGKVLETGHSRLPVYDQSLDTIVGILYVKDLFCADGLADVSLSTLAHRAFVVPDTKRVDALLEEFKMLKTHIAIVVDEFGGTAGLVTLEDILEEIVGEIEDEHDRHRRAIERAGDDAILADGVVSLYDIAEEMNVEMPAEEFETVGGLIYDRVGGVPRVGQSFDEHGLRLTIEKMDGQRIRRVRIVRLNVPDSVSGEMNR